MYFFDDERHKLPHIHARYQVEEASISIIDGVVLSGRIPQGKIKLVQAWIAIHCEDLMADWELAVTGEDLYKIEPLK